MLRIKYIILIILNLLLCYYFVIKSLINSWLVINVHNIFYVMY